MNVYCLASEVPVKRKLLPGWCFKMNVNQSKEMYNNRKKMALMRNREHSHAEVENDGTICPLPPYVFVAWCIINKGHGTFVTVLQHYLFENVVFLILNYVIVNRVSMHKPEGKRQLGRPKHRR
jgi:hypothetical protein